ncbi:MAG TPA: hypothetical protein VIV60_24205 [Polyangiaceae bacterium]
MLLSIIDQEKRWLQKLIGVVLLIVFVLRFLFGTITGSLLFAWLLYTTLPYWSGVQPWGLSELLVWFFELSDEAKIGLASSLVTVLGFFIALHTTMYSWRRQTATGLRMSAADNIDRVISEVNTVIFQIQLFAETTAREVQQVRDQNLSPDVAPILSVLSEDVQTFRANRQRLLQLQQESIDLAARYSVLFLPLSGTEGVLDAINQDIATVTKLLWIPAPAGGTDHPDHRRQLMAQVDPEKYQGLADACETALNRIAGVQGGLRGVLMNPVLEFNAVALSRILRLVFKRRDD